VTIHRVWIGKWIYWILRIHNYNSLISSHILLCTVGTLCLLFLLGTASQWLLGFCVLLPQDCTTVLLDYYPGLRTGTVLDYLHLTANHGFQFSRYITGDDPIQNTDSTVGVCASAVFTWQLLSHCLWMGVYAETFPSNGCLWQLHNSGFHHTCRNIFKLLHHMLCKWLFNHMKLLKDETIFIKLYVTLYWPFKSLSIWKYFAKANCVENPLK
jgi:hypothetical protein